MIANIDQSRNQSLLAQAYLGNVVISGSDTILAERVQIELLNDLVIKISFDLGKDQFIFRAVLQKKDEGILFLIQKRVTKKYILNGRSGFLHSNKGVHGGYLLNLDAFYFHITIQFFDGTQKEVYFLGKDEKRVSLNFLN